MNYKNQIKYLLDDLLQHEYTVELFIEEYSRIYNIELDYADLTKIEHDLMYELSIVTGRFSKYEDELRIPNLYYSESDVIAKATKVYSQLFSEPNVQGSNRVGG